MNAGESKIEAIFLAALERSSVEERAEFLQRECGNDHDLRRRIEQLLSAQPQLGSFLISPPPIESFKEDAEPDMLGTMIGPYKLREVLGEGGMGIVYVAEQEKPLRRKVALKVIKPGMDTREVIARFEAERQALALMDHPNIAKVLDAGTTAGEPSPGAPGEDGGSRIEKDSAGTRSSIFDPLSSSSAGRSYFVMELVRGLPITDYCDQRRLSPRERLKLFITVCQAVQHAHQRGIIHRDLKPSNVMITLHDGVPVPKVIDFGVAKALNQKLTEQTLYTRNMQMVGTPLYMSPEQAELSGLDVDTRSDVYSLGVLLYELLTDHTPFDKETFSKVGYDEMRRMIREDEPPRPSHRVSTLAVEVRSTVSRKRGLEERQLARTLRGELEWIVMKALEKDRTQRYGSADALAADLQRYLEEKTVQACPPSIAYRLRKLARRKRGTFVTIAFVAPIALLIGFAGSTLLQTFRASPADKGLRRTATDDTAEQSTDHHEDKQTESAPALAFNPPQQERSRLFGLNRDPPAYPGMERWQLITNAPRSFPHHNWKLAWSPDSRFVAFGDGNDVRVHSVPELRLVRVLVGHTNSVIAVDWSRDGRQIASSSADGTIRLWDAATGIPGPVLVGHRGRVDAVAWHPDSRRLASGARDNSVRLWTSDGVPGAVLHGHTDHVYSVAWNREGTCLASAGNGDGIRLWTAEGKPQLAIRANGQSIRTVAWSPDGNALLAPRFGAADVRIWDLEGDLLQQFTAHQDRVVAAAWNPDGTRFATASWDNTVRLWSADGAPGAVLHHEGDAYSVQWSPDGEWIATGGGDRSIRLWRADGEPGPRLIGNPYLARVAWNPDGRSFAVGVGDGTTRIYSEEGTKQVVLEGHSRPVKAVDWSPDGSRLVSGSVDGTICLWTPREKLAGPIGLDPDAVHEINCAVWSPDGEKIAVMDNRLDSSPAIHQWFPATGKKVALEGHGPHLYELAFNPVDGRMASVEIRGSVRIWSPNGELTGTFNVGELLASVAWKPDGSQLASGCEDGTIQIWRADGQPLRLLKGHADRVSSIAWSSDGAWMVSSGRDNTVRLWSGSGDPIEVFDGHAGEIPSVRWRPRSAQFVSAGNDATLHFWNAQTRRNEGFLVVLPEKQSIKLSPEGKLLSGDRVVFESNFTYLVEQPSGATEILAPADFERRAKIAR